MSFTDSLSHTHTHQSLINFINKDVLPINHLLRLYIFKRVWWECNAAAYIITNENFGMSDKFILSVSSVQDFEVGDCVFQEQMILFSGMRASLRHATPFLHYFPPLESPLFFFSISLHTGTPRTWETAGIFLTKDSSLLFQISHLQEWQDNI